MFPLCLRKLTSAAQKEVDGPWRLSTWADVSHVPGLERGGAEDVCRELEEEAMRECQLQELPFLFLLSPRSVCSAFLRFLGDSPSPREAPCYWSPSL